MITDQYIQRQGLLGLLCAQAFTVCLHWSHLPVWLWLLAVVVFVWRMQIYRCEWSFPNRFIRGLLVVFSIAAVIGYFREWYALEPMVILLLIAFLLKLLEVSERRDGIILIYVGLFGTSSAFLFDQGIVASILGVVTLFLWLAALVILQTTHTRYFSSRVIKIVGGVLLQAVPLMLLMLFVFPRLGALWSVPLQSSSAVTGVGDSMSPGYFSDISRSRELAFRVRFLNGEPPAPKDRYWRGLVLSQFDGRQWRRFNSEQEWLQAGEFVEKYHNEPGDLSLDYEIVLEATNTPWVYGIPLAQLPQTEFKRTRSNEIFLSEPVTKRIKYQVSSVLNHQVNESQDELRRALLLPVGLNPQTIDTARLWRQQTNSEEDFIRLVMRFYNDQFTYTLSPPVLGRNSVDEFLFSTQRGFCEHFASSFVVMMRAVGIPARVVVGYQGGEWNADDQYLIVRQYDAHAWAEVWRAELGWVRVDPTGAVAPDRIEQGLFDSISEEEQALMDSSLLPSFAWLNRLALQWDSFNYRWQRWVLSYDQDTQNQWLQELLGNVTPIKLALVLFIPAFILLTIFGILTLHGVRKPSSRSVRLYQVLQRRLHRRGVEVLPGETVSQFCQRAGNALPKKRTQINAIEKVFNQLLYQKEQSLDKVHFYQLRRQIMDL